MKRLLLATAFVASLLVGGSSAIAKDHKVFVCHADGNGGYNLIFVSQNGYLNGHAGHEGDFLFVDDGDPATEDCAVAEAA